MSLFGSLARELKTSDSITWGELNTLWGSLIYGGGVQSRSGPVVNWHTTLKTTTALGCTRRICEGTSTVPLKLYKKAPGSNARTEATDHPLYDLLAVAPNPWQDSLQFRETLTAHAVLAGNAYAFINRVDGRIAELIIIPPDMCQAIPSTLPGDYSVTYRVTGRDGSTVECTASEVLHIRGLSWDGIKGLDAVHLAREALGLSLASEQTHAMVHAHGARPSGIISVDKTLGETELVKLAAWVKRHYGGLDNVSRVMLLDSGAKFTPFDMKGVDAQHIQLRQFQVEEICRAFGVMPIMVGYSGDKAPTFASAEQLFIAHLVHTVRPWHRRFEYAIRFQLLTAEERKQGYYPKFLDAEFLRASATERATFYKTNIESGMMLRNEAREFEDWDHVEGLDRPVLSANVVVLDDNGLPIAPPAPPGGPTVAGAQQKLLEAFVALLDELKFNQNHDRRGLFSFTPGGPRAEAMRRARIAATAAWLRSDATRNVMASALHASPGGAAKALLAASLNTLLYHVGQMDQGPMQQEIIKTEVHNLASNLNVSAGRAKDMLRATLGGLKTLRSGAKVSADDEALLPSADDLQRAIDALDATEIHDG